MYDSDAMDPTVSFLLVGLGLPGMLVMMQLAQLAPQVGDPPALLCQTKIYPPLMHGALLSSYPLTPSPHRP